VSLSASIPALKSKARKLRRAEQIRLSEALDRIAASEGYSTWSLLIAKQGAPQGQDLLARLDAGDLVLIAARPRQGKTLCALQLLVSALRRQQQGWFFSLENDDPHIDALLESLGEPRSSVGGALAFEHSDSLDARHIVDRVRRDAGAPGVVVVDYLQLLDQRRSSPPLQEQVSALGDLARQTGHVVVVLSQIRSAFDESPEPLPSIDDVRPLDTLDFRLFDKFVFLHEGRLRLHRSLMKR